MDEILSKHVLASGDTVIFLFEPETALKILGEDEFVLDTTKDVLDFKTLMEDMGLSLTVPSANALAKVLLEQRLLGQMQEFA